MRTASRPSVDSLPGGLPASALDQRVAIVGTSGSGKTHTAKGWVERLLDDGARVCIIDPTSAWWGLRAAADGQGAGYPVIVFGGRHADVPLTEGMGAALGRLIATHALSCVVDLSELGSSAARRRFMSAFSEAIYEANEAPLHLVLDEADLFAPQRPLPDQNVLLGRIEEIVRRGRVRGFIPWLITQRPAVVHKDVLSQADILIAMKLTSSQDRDAIGGWIEGQADRAEGKRILAELPRLARGEGWIWSPGDDVLAKAAFPPIRTFDSSRTPKRGERATAPVTLAEVDLSAIAAALADAEEAAAPEAKGRAGATASRELSEARKALSEAHDTNARLLAENRDLRGRLARVAEAAALDEPPPLPVFAKRPNGAAPKDVPRPQAAPTRSHADGELHPAARKLLAALAQHAPGRFTWGQAATLAGLKSSGGHFNAGRKQLRDDGLIDESGDGMVAASKAGMAAAGEVPPAPSTPQERLVLWCAKLPSPAPEMLRALVGCGERFVTPHDLAAMLGKQPTGGHWNSGLATLRNNGLVELDGKSVRAAGLLREAGG